MPPPLHQWLWSKEWDMLVGLTLGGTPAVHLVWRKGNHLMGHWREKEQWMLGWSMSPPTRTHRHTHIHIHTMLTLAHAHTPKWLVPSTAPSSVLTDEQAPPKFLLPSGPHDSTEAESFGLNTRSFPDLNNSLCLASPEWHPSAAARVRATTESHSLRMKESGP